MLARPGRPSDLERVDLLFEPKIDGIRALCRKSDALQFFNRRGIDVSSRYPEFDFASALDADACVIDGEIVLYDRRGNPNFAGLMKRHLGTGPLRARDPALRYAVFDILTKDGENLTGLPLTERKHILADTVGSHPHLELMVFTTDGPRLWEIVKKRGLEGVIAKQSSSTYRPGRRTHAWRKIKTFETLDAVIVGFTSTQRPVSALGLAVYDGDALRFVGKVGTGFSAADARTLRRLLEPDRTDHPTVDVSPQYSDLIWVTPTHVCEVRYLEFGSQDMLRNPTFLRLRPDKPPHTCRLETQIVTT